MANDRWISVVHYRTESGLVDVVHYHGELSDLHDLVERGPSWYSIDRIETRINPNRQHGGPNYTVQDAERE